MLKFAFSLFIIMGCSSPSDSPDNLTIQGTIVNACTGEPLPGMDIQLRALLKNNDNQILAYDTKANNQGHFYIEALSYTDLNIWQGIYIAINHEVQLYKTFHGQSIGEEVVSHFDTLYSIYRFRTNGSIIKDVELAPRKPITIVVKRDTSDITTKIDYIYVNESYNGPLDIHYYINKVYYNDSLNIRLAAGQTHSLLISLKRDNDYRHIDRDLTVSCDDNARIIIYY